MPNQVEDVWEEHLKETSKNKEIRKTIQELKLPIAKEIKKIIVPMAEQNKTLQNEIKELKKGIKNILPVKDSLGGLVQDLDIQEKKRKTPIQEVTNENFNDVTNTRINTNRKTKKTLQGIGTTAKDYSNKLYQALVNKMHPIDQKAKRTGNTRLRDLAQGTLVSSGKGQYNIGTAQTDYKGNRIGESLTSIFDTEIKNEELSRYLYLKENINRAENGKNIFGKNITSELSQKLAKDIENRHPEYRDFLNKVVKYGDNELQLLVDSGLISKADAKIIKEKNPIYIPVERLIDAQRRGNTGEITSGKGIKKARFGSADIMSAPEAMANRTIRLRNKIALNELIKELAKTNKDYESAHSDNKAYNIETLDSADVEDLHFTLDAEMDRDSIFAPENNSVSIDKNGNYKATYFEDGVAHTFNISEAEYNALKGHEANVVEQFATATLGKISNIHRDILTKWSATFPVKNAIKDIQDVTVNSKYLKQFPKNYVVAIKEMAQDSELWNTYLANGGGSLSYYDYEKGLKADGKIKKIVKWTPEKISEINEIIEQLPRFTEFISTLEDGKSIEEAIYNAAEITTNFSRGGEITKALNRSGATFLNASVQGFDKFFRNFTGQNGAKAFTLTLAKGLVFGAVPALLNHLLYGDDEDYEDLRNSDKDLYYLFKYDNGKFIRIPKGRALSVFGTVARRVLESAEGKEDSFDGMVETIGNQIAPNNPISDNVLAPIVQTVNNKTWYGGDIVSSSLQKELPKNQYDESTDAFSIWLGQKTGRSPMKINYLLDQYSGGVGDILLPLTTKEAHNNVITDQFTTDSVLKNKNVSKFYDTIDELTKIANDKNSTDDDQLKLMYMTEVSSDVSKLYKEKRAIQNSDLRNSEKSKQVREIQEKINVQIKDALNTYNNVQKDSEDITKIKDTTYLKIQGKWKDLSDTDKEKIEKIVANGGEEKDYLRYKIDNTFKNNEGRQEQKTNAEKIQYLLNSDMNKKSKQAIYEETIGKEDKTYTKFNGKIDTYLKYKDSYNKAKDKDNDGDLVEEKELKNAEKTEVLLNNGFSDSEIKGLYEATMVDDNDILYKTLSKDNVNIKEYLKYKEQEFEADKEDDGTVKGKSISGSKKKKIYNYINNMNISYEQKLLLLGSQYKLSTPERTALANYINNSKLNKSDKMYLYGKMQGFTVYKDGRVTW